MKYTKGPWEVIPAGSGFLTGTITGPAPDSVTEARYMPLAMTLTYKSEIHAGFYEITEEERLANAKLIAAAPDMEHAIRTLLQAVKQDVEEQFPGHHQAYLDQVAIPRAIEALKKAGIQYEGT